jgi:predicted site-specific integrase-resolvase
MDENCYMHIREAKKVLGVSTQTLHNWDRQNKIRVTRMPSGVRFFHKEDVYRLAGLCWTPPKKERYIYARVSSKKQVDDLERQQALLRSQFPDHQLVADIGSGLDWKRKGLQTLLEHALRGDVEQIVVAHRDRLCRFGFELLQFIFQQSNVELLVLDQDTGKSSDQELADDILAIVHVYSCRAMGKRRYARASSASVPEREASNNAEMLDGDREICLQSGA